MDFRILPEHRGSVLKCPSTEKLEFHFQPFCHSIQKDNPLELAIMDRSKSKWPTAKWTI